MSLSDTSDSVLNIPILDIVIHPKYRASTKKHDIAIIKLTTEVPISYKVKPICLQTEPLKEESMEHVPMIAVGWGTTEYDHFETSNYLLKTSALQ